MFISPSSAPSTSISKGGFDKSAYSSSLPWFRRLLAMLNWRPVVDYELREIEFVRSERQYEKRMQQLESEDEQLRKEDEQRKIAHEQRIGFPPFQWHPRHAVESAQSGSCSLPWAELLCSAIKADGRLAASPSLRQVLVRASR